MLGRLKKRIENLMGDTSAATAEPTTETPAPSVVKAPRQRPQWQPDPEVAAKLARREAQRREVRFLLKERIHNRSVLLMSEVRNHLLSEIHNSLEEHSGPRTLKGIPRSLWIRTSFVLSTTRSTVSRSSSSKD